MNLYKNLNLDKQSSIPIYQQLGDYIFNLIEEGKLTANQKLPPIRKLAKEAEVNSVTVVSAYKYLENKKAVYSQTGSGTFVSPIPLENIPEPVINENINTIIKNPIPAEGVINFTSTSLPQELFPTTEFKQAFDILLDREKGGAFGTMDSQGYAPLRESICTYLKYYGITATAETVQILSGAQQGIDVVAKAMISYGDIVFMEKPTFYGAAGAFLSRGCQIIEIPMETDGMDTTALENLVKLYHPKFLYVMAYFQTPTGITYSAVKKRKILDMAEKYNFFIIEDDNLYDFNYTDEALVPFKALDNRNRVVYIKSFSKILMPGLRIGFAVLPKKILQKMVTAKYTTDISTSGFLQKALDIYLTENSWQQHIKTIRSYAKDKYKTAVKYADRYLKPYLKYTKPNGGISLWLDTGNIPAETLLSSAVGKNVLLSLGSQFYINGEESHHLRLCFVNVSDEKLEAGIRRLGECAKNHIF
ncbi:MAG: PLP-dependent aminotransferase family protein [Lachnospiraceae bacterium]|nr:PLP-dependent aminotransferase family protein [Lachnospiraceae bacterium]